MGRGTSRWGPTGGSTTIEFVAPDEQAFDEVLDGWHVGGDRAATQFGATRRSGRGRTGVSAVIAVAILFAGTVAAWGNTQQNDRSSDRRPAADDRVPLHERGTSYDDVPRDRATDGATERERTGQATGAIFEVAPVDGSFPVEPWILDAPGDLVPTEAVASETNPPMPGWFQFWAEPRSDRNSGRWLGVQLLPNEAGAPPQAVVSEVDGLRIAGWVTRDRVDHLQFVPTPDWTVRLTASGWSPQALVDIAASFTVIDHRPVYDAPQLRDLDLLITRSSVHLGLEAEYIGGRATSIVTWESDQGDRVSLLVGRDPSGEADLLRRYLLTSSAGTPLSGPLNPRAVGPYEADAGRLPGLEDRNVVRWSDGAHHFALIGTVRLDDLLALAPTVRAASGTEWTDLLIEVAGDTVASPSADEIDPE